MRVVICGSIYFADEMKRARDRLEGMGHEVDMPASIGDFNIKTQEDADSVKGRDDHLTVIKPTYTIKHFDKVKNGDAILVVNMEKHGIKNYIGGATFSEIMLAFYYKKKIFFLNPIPADEKLKFMHDELASVQPVIVGNDFSLVK
ncbi:MAG: hypothetical protein ABIH52_03555 [Candidatus Aenigmatarchaeota archaeon]|nr:hypothetical protein [Nanoarchaeota archaeon]